MKKTAILFVFVILLCARTSKADYYNDGGTHNIDCRYNNGIVIGNSSSGEATTVNIVYGGSVPNFTITGDSYINILQGGRIESGDGSYGGVSDSYDNTQITIQGGAINGSLRAWNNSIITISSGTIYSWIRAYNDSVVDISGGNISRELMLYNNSVVDFSGGTIGLDLLAYDISQVTISGGSIDGKIYAGFYSYDESIITLLGTNFAINGEAIAYGEITSTVGNSWGYEPYRHLTGILANGDLLDNDFYISGNSSIVLAIPEPATLLLIGLGGMILRRKF